VYESPSTNTVFVAESKLDVMLEEDYLGNGERGMVDKNNPSTNHQSPTADIKSIIREIILPEIKREVNEGQSFAPLRQIMHSLILASWYKSALKDSILTQAFANQEKTQGTQVADSNAKQKIYEQYVQAFRQGAYDVLREEYDPATNDLVAKKYFSGGILPGQVRFNRTSLVPAVVLEAGQNGDLAMVSTDLAMLTEEEKEFLQQLQAGILEFTSENFKKAQALQQKLLEEVKKAEEKEEEADARLWKAKKLTNKRIWIILLIIFAHLPQIHAAPSNDLPLIHQQKGGIDLEKVNVGRSNGAESSIKINFVNDPAMMEQLRNSTGLRVIIGDIVPMKMPMLNHLLGLNADGSDNKSADSNENFQEVAALKEE